MNACTLEFEYTMMQLHTDIALLPLKMTLEFSVGQLKERIRQLEFELRCVNQNLEFKNQLINYYENELQRISDMAGSRIVI